MPHFTIRSAAAGPVSILNPVSVETVPNNTSGPIPALQNAEPLPVKRQHLCHTCGKNFTTSGHLVRHSRIHSGTKDFVCPYPDCYKSCSRQDNLTQHYRVHLPMEERKQPNLYVRARMNEMRQQLEQLAPLPTEVKNSPSSVSSEGTPLIDSGLASASHTPMLLTSAATPNPPQLQANRSPTFASTRTERWPPASPSNRLTSSDSRRPPRPSSSSTPMSSSRRRPPPLAPFIGYEPGEEHDPEHNPVQEQSASPLTPFSPIAPRTDPEWSPASPTTYRISYARGE